MNSQYKNILLLATALLAALPSFSAPVYSDEPATAVPDAASTPSDQLPALPPASPVAPNAPSLPAAAPSEHKGFLRRFIQAYNDDWHPAPPPAVAPAPAPGAEPPYRGDPPPVANPPYPFSVWPIGGTPWIGYPNATAYPLTTALQTGPNGDWWKKPIFGSTVGWMLA